MTEQQLRTKRRITLVYLYALSALWGVFRALTIEPILTESAERLYNGVWLMLALGTQLGFMWFCSADAKLVGKSLLRLAKIGIFLGWPIGVPIYAIWARGIVRGLGMVLLHGILLLLTFMCVAILAILVYRGPAWFA
jgi:hypothetical protein